MMYIRRANSSSLPSFLLIPLFILVVIVISHLSSFSHASALPQTADGPLHKILEVNELEFNFIEQQPYHVQFRLRVSIAEDEASFAKIFFPGDIERAQREPEAILSDLIDQYSGLANRAGGASRTYSHFRFAFHLADPLPGYITDAPEPERPFLEDNMWILDLAERPGELFRRMREQFWRPYYETFYMDGPFRMNVFYLGLDRNIYTGVVDIPAEAIGPYQGAVKAATLQPQYQPMSFRLTATGNQY